MLGCEPKTDGLSKSFDHISASLDLPRLLRPRVGCGAAVHWQRFSKYRHVSIFIRWGLTKVFRVVAWCNSPIVASCFVYPEVGIDESRDCMTILVVNLSGGVSGFLEERGGGNVRETCCNRGTEACGS